MLNNIFLKTVSFKRQCVKTVQSHTGHKWQYGACTLYAAYLGLQTNTQNM